MQYKDYKYLPNDMLQLTFECPVCQKDNSVTVNQYSFEDWSEGVLKIHEAFPNHSPAERELMLTGIDEGCYPEPEPDDMECKICAPLGCDDPDRHLGVPSEYTPLKNRGCHCGADFDGRDCMCFE